MLLSDMEENHILKFQKINKYLIDSLVHSRIYFARPDNLNDPFDCQVDAIKSLNNAIAQSSDSEKKVLENILNNEELQKLFNKSLQAIKHFGVFSASRKRSFECSLMWSHYANDHRGICLVYAIPNSFISEENGVIGIANVEYEPNILTEWFRKLPNNIDLQCGPFEKIKRTILTAKNTCWQYENEMRMIRKTAGTVAVDQSYLQHICFGLKTSDDDKKLMRKIAQKFGYDVSYSEIQRTESDFGIKAVDID